MFNYFHYKVHVPNDVTGTYFVVMTGLRRFDNDSK
jgi:hypothetical protein